MSEGFVLSNDDISILRQANQLGFECFMRAVGWGEKRCTRDREPLCGLCDRLLQYIEKEMGND